MAQSQPDHCSPPIDDQRLSKPISITTPKPGPGICCRALALYKATSVIEARKEFAVRQATEQKKASEAADDNRLDFEGTVVDADLLAPRSPRSSKGATSPLTPWLSNETPSPSFSPHFSGGKTPSTPSPVLSRKPSTFFSRFRSASKVSLLELSPVIDSMFDQMNPDRWSSSLSSYEELILPKDPDTKANWIDFGIICTELKDVRCALCSRGCCKTIQAGYTGKDHRTPRDVRDAARKAYDRYKISATSLHKKLSTMKTCTFCARTVCGVCSSLCPDEWCSSVNCSECNPRMWESCAWHQEETLSYQISKEEEVLRRASASMGNGTVEAALRRITSDI